MLRAALATFDRERERLPAAAAALASEEDAALVEALGKEAVAADVVPWTNESVRWDRYDIVVIRTTWGYDRTLADFLAWTRRVASVARLVNAAPTAAWNSNKRYLLDLARRGVPIPETVVIPHGERRDLAALMDGRGWTKVVVKRAVAAGGRGQQRVPRSGAPSTGQAHLDAILGEGDALVQPYLRSIEGAGERSIVILDGKLSHAVAKIPANGQYLAHPGHGAHVLSHTPTGKEWDVARRALEAAPDRPLYARVDLVDLEDGAPAVMELELIEPYLFLREAAGAASRFARAIAAAGR